jgi:molybdopterin/thiamine biosynthesis adenylyltransferase
MAHLIQVGVGSGGMPVLDMLVADARISAVTLIEPDIYKPHNVERHLFPRAAVGRKKADLAAEWVHERRPELNIEVLALDLMDPALTARIEDVVQSADIAVCAADNEPAKYHWDALMRRFKKPWTLGEVLSGGVGGFVHWFVPCGPCYGCVASYLKRTVQVDQPKAPDYALPGGAVPETTIPASKACIHTIASLHALVTLDLLDDPAGYEPGFTTLLLSLRKVPGVFDESFRPFRFRIPRTDECLICRGAPQTARVETEELDRAVDQALARLGHA